MKMQQLHEQRELSWHREQDERERRIRQNRANAHAELTERCLLLEENQAELCRLTDNVLRPVMRSRLKGLEKRHQRRQEGFCRHQDEFEKRRQLPPLLPGEGTMRISGPGSSVFDRGLANRKLQEVVGSPGAPLRSKQHLANLAKLLSSDLDAAQGEETAKSTVHRPADMKGRKFVQEAEDLPHLVRGKG